MATVSKWMFNSLCCFLFFHQLFNVILDTNQYPNLRLREAEIDVVGLAVYLALQAIPTKVDEWIVLLCSESFFGSHGHSESLEQGCKHRPFSGTGKEYGQASH
uniref:Uncharacterized protein n=1 Tax=Rhodnius prolixus TaxID=13249 RepID=T1IA83_RHOPR